MLGPPSKVWRAGFTAKFVVAGSVSSSDSGHGNGQGKYWPPQCLPFRDGSPFRKDDTLAVLQNTAPSQPFFKRSFSRMY